MAEAPRVGEAEGVAPLPDGFVRDEDATLGEQVFDVTTDSLHSLSGIEDCHERSKEHIRVPRSLSGYVSYQRRNAMPKSEVLRGARWKRRAAGRVELPDALEGQVEEICRDLSEQVKRMRQLQEQADELRTALREWACPGGAIVRTD